MRQLCFLVVSMFSATAASGAVLSFAAGNACGLVSCAPGDFISQDYGDNPFVDISYSSRSAFGNAALTQASLHYGGLGFGDLNGVAYAGTTSSDVIEIKFTPRQGASFALTEFDIAGSPSTGRTTNIHVYDLVYNLLLDYSTIAPGNSHNAQNFIAYDFPTGLIIQVGMDGFNVGIDNITYQASINGNPVGGVPEPASWLLMVAGFGLVGSSIRRQRAMPKSTLASGLVAHSREMTVAARAMSEKKTVGHRS